MRIIDPSNAAEWHVPVLVTGVFFPWVNHYSFHHCIGSEPRRLFDPTSYIAAQRPPLPSSHSFSAIIAHRIPAFHSLEVSQSETIIMSSRDHILQVPPVVLGLRIVQLITAIVILGLAAYGITFISFDGDDLSLFTVRPWSSIIHIM